MTIYPTTSMASDPCGAVPWFCPVLRHLLVALRVTLKSGDLTARLALVEGARSMPWSAALNACCKSQKIPAGVNWLAELKRHEQTVLSKRA